MHESMTGPGLADTMKVMDRNRLKLVISIKGVSNKVAIVVEPMRASQCKLCFAAALSPAGFGFSSILKSL
jgi:hypothetical protein